MVRGESDVFRAHWHLVSPGKGLYPRDFLWWRGDQEKNLAKLQKQLDNPLFGMEGLGWAFPTSPSKPSLISQLTFLYPRPGEKNPKSNIFHHMPKTGDREEPKSLRLSLERYPSAHLSMVLGKGDTWVLTSKQGDPSL